MSEFTKSREDLLFVTAWLISFAPVSLAVSCCLNCCNSFSESVVDADRCWNVVVAVVTLVRTPRKFAIFCRACATEVSTSFTVELVDSLVDFKLCE